MLLNVVHFLKNLSLLPRATFRVLPAINSSVLSPNWRLSTAFIDLKGQIVKTHLKFLVVPFIKSRQIFIPVNALGDDILDICKRLH